MVGLSLLASLSSGAAALSPTCARLTSDLDAVLLIDIQNCFMEMRPLPTGATRYDVPASFVEDDAGTPMIQAGPLPVATSAEIIPVANEWVQAAMAANASTIYTLDWH
eukprot:2867137-Prymnesium_polylepis.1